MQTYKYEVRDASGQINTGLLRAESLSQAASVAMNQGGYVLNVAPVSGGGGTGDVLARIREFKVEMGPSLKDIMSFTNQLAVMIKAGINIRSAIGGIASQVPNARFRSIIEQMKADVESGQPFSEALAKHPKVFSPLYINMVRASELSGNFGHMLDRIAAYLAQQLETRSMVRGAMIYPAIIAFMAVSTTIFLLTFVLPKFTTLFAGKEALLPAPTKMLVAISDIMRTYWYLIILAVAAAVTGLVFGVRTPRGREIWDHFKLKLPLFKVMFRALYITRGLNTMGELVNAGVPMLETLEITAEVSGNSLYQRMWHTVHDSVKQ